MLLQIPRPRAGCRGLGAITSVCQGLSSAESPATFGQNYFEVPSTSDLLRDAVDKSGLGGGSVASGSMEEMWVSK